MGLFNKEKDQFIPRCRPINDSKEGSNTQRWECHITEIRDGKKFETDEPVKLVVENGRPLIYETGGANTSQIDKLKNYLQKNMV